MAIARRDRERERGDRGGLIVSPIEVVKDIGAFVGAVWLRDGAFGELSFVICSMAMAMAIRRAGRARAVLRGTEWGVSGGARCLASAATAARVEDDRRESSTSGRALAAFGAFLGAGAFYSCQKMVQFPLAQLSLIGVCSFASTKGLYICLFLIWERFDGNLWVFRMRVLSCAAILQLIFYVGSSCSRISKWVSKSSIIWELRK